MNNIIGLGGIVLFIWGAVKKSRGMMIGGYIATAIGVAASGVEVGMEAHGEMGHARLPGAGVHELDAVPDRAGDCRACLTTRRHRETFRDVAAYDAATGKEAWRTFTTAAPGEPGGDTWPGETHKNGGGSIWITGTYDPAKVYRTVSVFPKISVSLISIT